MDTVFAASKIQIDSSVRNGARNINSVFVKADDVAEGYFLI